MTAAGGALDGDAGLLDAADQRRRRAEVADHAHTANRRDGREIGRRRQACALTVSVKPLPALAAKTSGVHQLLLDQMRGVAAVIKAGSKH